ncbi:MAG: fibronectin type III domain-containing protein, partial [Desulfobacterales bacterium]
MPCAVRRLPYVLCLLPLLLFLLAPCAAVAGTAAVTIGWDPPEDPVAGYEVAYGNSSGNYEYVFDVGNNTSCSISGLEEGATYYIAARSYTSDGLKSVYSGELVHTVALSGAGGEEEGNRITHGLRALYTFDEGSGTTIHDTSGTGTPLDLSVSSGTVNWLSGALAVTSAALIKSDGPATKVIDACRATNEISIEAWLKPANTTQGGPARIVTLSKDTSYRNFTLGQSSASYDLRLRTTATDGNGRPSLSTPGGSLKTTLTHIVYTRDAAGVAKVYVNGTQVSSRTIGGDLSNWQTNFHLGLANEMTKNRPWLGELHLVAVYGRALSLQEVHQNFQAGANSGNTQPPVDSDPVDSDPVDSDPPPVDTDGDGISDDDEIDIFGTDPNKSDTDNDGLNDGDEIDIFGTDPNISDTDNDGINDGDEWQYWGNKWDLDYDGDGTVNLLDNDSDDDSIADGIEVSNGSDPADHLD